MDDARKRKPKIGILGGMGPSATIRLLDLIHHGRGHTEDQDHPVYHLVMASDIPDRTEALLENGSSPTEKLFEHVSALKAAGCTHVGAACITILPWLRPVAKEVGLLLLDPVSETPRVVASPERTMLFATRGTVWKGVYQEVLPKLLLPDSNRQARIMEAIHQIKGENLPKAEAIIEEVLAEFAADTDRDLLIGCTDLSLCAEVFRKHGKIYDTLEILAEMIVGMFADKEIPVRSEVAECCRPRR